MPEASEASVILITTSHQALERARNGNKETYKSDCVTALLFACFNIEANINKIIDFTNKEGEVKEFLGYDDPGMQDKLIWLYFKFGHQNDSNISKINKKHKKEYITILEKELDGYQELRDFRNKVSHGEIDESYFDITRIESLRKKSKKIVDHLFYIAAKAHYKINRTISYFDVYI